MKLKLLEQYSKNIFNMIFELLPKSKFIKSIEFRQMSDGILIHKNKFLD